MKRFLIQHARLFLRVACFLFIGLVCMTLAGCGIPTWLTDAQGIIGVVATSITSIGALIAGLTGNAALAAGLAVVSAWVTKLETGISDVEALVTQYNEAPDPTLLANIEAALADVEANLQQDFSNLGLPPAFLTVASGVAALALSQLEAWGSLIPALKATAMSTIIIKRPYTKAEYKALVKELFATKTGDPEVDAALAKVKL